MQAEDRKEREERSAHEVVEEVKEVTLVTGSKTAAAVVDTPDEDIVAAEPAPARKAASISTPRLAKDSTTEDIDFNISIK